MDTKNDGTVGIKYDKNKLRYDLIPPEALKAIAEIFTYGAVKYAPNNWQLVEPKERYLAAAQRHIEAYRLNEHIDNIEKGGSGLYHLDHAITSLIMLREKEYTLCSTKKENQ